MADEQIVTSIVAKADLSSLVSEVHRATSSLQQLQRELNASNRSIASATRVANNLFRDTLVGSGMFSSHFVNLNSDVDKFGKNLDAGRLKLRDYFSTFQGHLRTSKGYIRELAREQVMLQNAVLQPLGRNAQGLMQYNVMIPRGLDAVKNSAQLARMEMQIMNRALSEGAGALINWGKNTQWAGRQLTVGLTVPLTMFGAQAARAFREADQELTRLVKVYGDLSGATSQELAQIRKDVVATSKELASGMGVSFKETIGLAADIAATGQKGNELLGSLKETTRLAVLGEVDRAEAMKATLAIQTAFKSNTKELTESINFLNAVENQTSTTLNDLVEAIPKAGTVIKQLGGNVEDLALYLTAMREGGVSASEGANALKSGLASMINPTKQTIGLMKDFGIDIMGMVEKNTGNTTGMILDLQKALDGLDPLSKARALEQMFGKFQFARMAALFNNLGKEGSQTLQVMQLMNASAKDLANVASRELGMVTESASGKYKRAIEGLRANLADMGDEFLGVATKFINAFSKVLEFFNNLPEPIKKAVTYLGGFTAIIGPVIMLTGVLANFFGYITKGIVQLKAFFQRAHGWRMLTPEIIATQKAADLVEKSFYSDAQAAEVLHGALTKLVSDYMNLNAAMTKGTVPVNPVVATAAGNVVMNPIRREVDPNSPYVGAEDTRAMSHVNPRDVNNPASLMGVVPGALPVNRGIAKTPQIYMHDRLPDVPGLTSVKGISTGIVAGEAARFHALMATLGMQTEAEVASLKKTIALGGTVSSELLATFDDILPMTTRLADNAATESAAIVAQLRAGKLTVDQAKAEIMAINAQLEASLKSEISTYAASRGRTIDFTKAPLMNQPVVDANAQFTLRDLYKKEGNKAVMEEFGRLRGIRTFGAPYSIQTTRLPKFEQGGLVEGFGPNKTTVSGPTSINYDDRLGRVPLGGYVLNQSASLDSGNSDLIAMAPYTFEDGGHITAALTPGEVVFGPKIHRVPGLYDALEAANNGYNFGGQIMRSKGNYGQEAKESPAYYRKQLGELVKFINSPTYEDSVRMRMVMLDAAELIEYGKLSPEDAVNKAFVNFQSAKRKSGGSLEAFIKERIRQVKRLERKYPGLKHPNRTSTRTPNSKALNSHISTLKNLMINDPRFANVAQELESMVLFNPKILNKAGVPYLQMRDARGIKYGQARAHLLRHGEVGYATRGHMGVAAVLDAELNSMMARMDQIKLMPDILHLTQSDAKDSLKNLIKKAGMGNMTTLDDIAVALSDPGNKFPSKKELADIKAGKALPLRATPEQKNSLKMLLQAISERKRWVVRGRPPVPVLASFNRGGGVVRSGRPNYGNVMSLLSPEKMLKVLATSKELSSNVAKGAFANMPPVSYGHMISHSSGRSYPVPGVSGLYKDADGSLKFFKGVPNEITAKAELYGTRMAREVFGLDSPEQTIRTIRNPLDPSGKSKLLGLESPFDPKFAVGGTGFNEDQMIRQTIASLIMGNKDLSRSNVFGNVLADVGAAGVFPKASMNTAYAKSMNSMEKQAMINLLAVRGGARKDFAYDTAPIAAGMTPRRYGKKMKDAMKEMHPKLIKFIESLPKADRGPYLSLLKRFEEGMAVDWSKYQSVHANPKFNSGGGVVRTGRYGYGRPGNPAARAAWEAKQRAQRERDAAAEKARLGSHGIRGQQYLTTGLGREAVRYGTTSFYNPGQVMMNQMIDPFKNSIFMKASYIQASFASLTASISHGIKVLTYQTKQSVPYVVGAYKDAGMKIADSARYYAARAKIAMQDLSTRVLNPIRLEAYQQHRMAGTLDTHYKPGMLTGPLGLTNWKTRSIGDQGTLESRKSGYYGFRKNEYRLDGQNISRQEAVSRGLLAPRGQIGMGGQMAISMGGMAAGSALMSKGQAGLGMGVMIGSSVLPMMMPQVVSGITKMKTAAMAAGSAFKSGGGGIKAFVTALTTLKAAGPLLAITAIVGAVAFLIKKTREWNKDAQLRFGMNAKAASQAGIEYTKLADKINLVKQKQSALQNVGKNGVAFGGITGLNMSIEELKKYKEDASKNLTEFVDSFNRADSGNIAELATNIKAQFLAAGMSVDEANKKIMGMIAASKNSTLAVKVLTDTTFKGIKDSSTAAEYSYKHLNQLIESGNSGTGEYKTKVIEGISSVIDLTDKSISAISVQKDAAGNLKGEYVALEEVINRMKAAGGFEDTIGLAAFAQLPAELQAISDQSDTIAGIYAKWRLLTKGVQINLKEISSETALAIDKFLTAFTAAQDQLIESGKSAFKSGLGFAGIDGTFKKVGYTMASLQDIIIKTGREAAIAQQKASQAAQDQNDKLQKQIDLIREAANAKLAAIDATERKDTYEIQLQKSKLDYQDAIAKGDFQAAERARLELVQLQKARQAEEAKLAIQEEAARKEKALQEQQKKIADAEKKRQIAYQNVQNEAARAQEALTKITNYSQQYKDLLLQKQTNEFITDPKLKASAQSQTDNQLNALVREIQKAATVTKGNAGYDIAADIKKAFGQFFDATGKALTFDSSKQVPTYGPNGLQVNTVTTKGTMGDVLNKDLAIVKQQATLITGGMTLKQLGELLVKELGDGKSGSSSGKMNPAKYATAGYNNTGIMDPNAPKGGTVVTQNGKTYIYSNDGIPLDVTTDAGKKIAKALKVDLQKITPIKLAPGGVVSGPGTGTSDSIPAMLSNGEFVINARSAQNIGYDNLHAINNFAMGGLVGNASLPKYNVGGLLARSQRLMMHTGGTANNVTIGDIVINAAPGMDERQLAK
ncbi:phage tail tape measure protein, partial [bacterium]|nr:phage tail tape measure protein [bacterium]